MSRIFIRTGITLGLLVVVGTLWRCDKSKVTEGEKLARIHCASCHKFPEPSLLTKEKWERAVLPQMAFRMGFNKPEVLYSIDYQDLAAVRSILPKKPVISEEQLELIQQYYLLHAPDSLPVIQRKVQNQSKQFDASYFGDLPKNIVTMIDFDSAKRKLYVGDAGGNLRVFDDGLNETTTVAMSSAPTHISFGANNNLVTLVGGLMPNDQRSGEIVSVDGHQMVSTLLDSLRRPVYFIQKDMDGDKLPDVVMCSFGNYLGGLSIFKQHGDHTYTEHLISATPGARKVVVTDWNHDGKNDLVALMAQGDERIILLENTGPLQYKEKPLLRFPPVYGSSYFELVDFNRDGYLDVLFTNGDNGDYTNILKPYHAVRIFENDKNGNLNEVWKYPMAGAWEANAADFDQDGDLDIAAISLFPDLQKHPEQCFIYFENKGDYQLDASVIPLASKNKWMAMTVFDQDRDGDLDIVIGAFYFEQLAASPQFRNNASGKALMILRNTLYPGKKTSSSAD